MRWYQVVVFAAIAAVWLWVLGRPLVHNLFNKARRDPVGHFNRGMSVLAEAPQRSLAEGPSAMGSFGGSNGTYRRGLIGTGAPMTSGSSMAKKRRLQIFLALCISVVVSLVLAIAFRGVFIAQHLLMDALLLGYIVLAARAGALEADRATTVTYLTPKPAQNNAMYIQAVNER